MQRARRAQRRRKLFGPLRRTDSGKHFFDFIEFERDTRPLKAFFLLHIFSHHQATPLPVREEAAFASDLVSEGHTGNDGKRNLL